jgi:hypothetical protein
MLSRTNQLTIALNNVNMSQVDNVKVVQAHVETVVAGMKKMRVQQEMSRVFHVESPAILLDGVPSPGFSSHNMVLTTLVRWRRVLHSLKRIQDKGRHRKVPTCNSAFIQWSWRGRCLKNKYDIWIKNTSLMN